MKLDLLTNATVVDDVIKYVQQSKEKLVNNTSLKEEEIQSTQEEEEYQAHQKTNNSIF